MRSFSFKDEEVTMNKRDLRLFNVFWFMLALLMTFSGFTAKAFAAEDSYPNKPIRLIVPFPPGGSNDIVARLISSKLAERLGKSVFVDNRGGAGSLIGTDVVAHSKPDGYTLLLISTTYPIHSSINSNLPYDPVKSFVPIAKLGAGPSVLGVFPGLPVKSLKELIALAKEKPGKLSCSVMGVGTFGHLATELFKEMADIDVVLLQFKGGGPAIIDTMGGHSQINFGTLTTTMPHIRSGKIKALGVGALKRSAALPDVPTISEAGLPGYEASTWWGILAPAGTPQAIVDRLNKDLRSILALPEVQNLFMAQGAESDYLGSAEFGKLIESEASKWAKVAKKANIKPE
jgi:tripartite-type tricarboxylate transporter receptor subunit TctC